MMNICVIGAGHVGLITAACFADLGHKVWCVDNDAKRIANLKKGIMPFYEPGLEQLTASGVQKKHLIYTTSIKEAVKKSEVVFIAVGTPMKENGEADLVAVENVVISIGEAINEYKLIVEKSTVPVETGTWIRKTISEIVHRRDPKIKFDVASNPEFLREGTAIADFLKPDRIVVGVESKRAEQILRQLYEPFKAPMVVTNIHSSEIIKHASNSFLSLKISFINMIADLCEKKDADIIKVAEGMGLDPRIGPRFFNAGIGFGGFCFPKDLAAFIHIGDKAGVNFALLREVERINEARKYQFIRMIKDVLWNLTDKKLGVFGLSFKANTDDMRYSPAADVIELLKSEGAHVTAYDPEAMELAKTMITGIKYAKSPYDVVKGADALLILTEWDQFAELDYSRIAKLLKKPVVFDGRNLLDPVVMKKQGFQYYSIGRAPVNGV